MLLKYSKNKIEYDKIYFSLIVVACLLCIPLFETTNNLFCKLLIVLSFTLIALGNSVFGVLNNKVLKLLGDISYSVYLLHGFVLFIAIYYVLGIKKVISYSYLEYSILICGLTPIIVIVGFTAYYLIEKPFIRHSKPKNKASIYK